MESLQKIVKINLLMCEECSRYIPDKFLRNFRVDNNLEPFYFYFFADGDYENEMISLCLDKVCPFEITIVCKDIDTDNCYKKFKELNKHITFVEPAILSYTGDQYKKSKHTLIFKVERYGL
jgi:hypothetical protein